MVKSILHKARTGFAMGLIAFATLAGSSLVFAQSAYAANCDKVNIVYCGLSGSSIQGYISSIKQHWNQNQPADFRQIARWGGWTDGIASGMTASNTKVGTLNANTGAITVDGRVVATNTHMSARFNGGRGFYPIKSGVWARPITVSHARASYKVVIAFNADGKAVAGIAEECGNIIKFTPTPPPPVKPPKPDLKCVNLTKDKVDGVKRTWKFTAKAYKANTTIKNYVFDFGDGTKETVKTDNKQAHIQHTFAEAGKTYKVRAYVNSTDKSDVTSANCVVSAKTAKVPPPPPPPVTKPSVVITKEVSKEEVAINESFTYTLKVTNNGNVDLTNVAVSDNAPEYVEFVSAPVGTLTAKTWKTTIASLKIGESQTFTIVAKATAYAENVVNTACVDATEVPGNPDDCDDVSIDIPKPPVEPKECKPGIPVGSPECEDRPVVITHTNPSLPNTGAGSVIATVAFVSIAAAVTHSLYVNGTPKLSFKRQYEN
ncbi:MAG: hypothetical protein QG629_409 [Patescibacteria group bacterium]|nr:DUF11 domain-containing protein [Candidatus Saccharibacteria bacterium]MDQ5963327.1 hypothetical protein [Patescibacteria group bacterium]